VVLIHVRISFLPTKYAPSIIPIFAAAIAIEQILTRSYELELDLREILREDVGREREREREREERANETLLSTRENVFKTKRFKE
jgi:hypothetical protein